MKILLWGLKFDFAGRLWAGIAKGSRDEIVTHFTDTEISVASGIRVTLSHCEPWSQHLTNEGIRQINRAIRNKDASLAKEVIDKSMTETSAPWCIDALKTAIVLVCTKCPTVLKEALPTSYY